MSMQDPISDMLTRIRNAGAVYKADVCMPYSKMKMAIAELLREEGYLEDCIEEVSDNAHKTLRLVLRYYEEKPVISTIKRVSKPGLRIYRGKEELPQVESGLGIAVISTNEGLMTDKQARRKGLGGEVICSIS
jgi:small subunit ribosomal protein S8